MSLYVPPLFPAAVEDRGGQVFNVKAYGAVGNGTTDDTSSIVAAYNAVVAAGGGTIYFPLGTYLVASGPIYVTDAKNIVWRGTGWGSSLVLGGSSGTQYLFGTGTAAIAGLTFVDLDMNVTYSAGSWSVFSIGAGTAQDVTFERVQFRGSSYTGSIPTFFNCSPSAAAGLQNFVLHACGFYAAGTSQIDGLLIRGVNGLVVDDCEFVNVNTPICPDNIYQKYNLQYTNNREVYTSTSVNSEGPDIMSFIGVVVAGNQQMATVALSGTDDLGGVLIDTHSGLITSDVVVTGNNFLQNPIQLAPQNGAAINRCTVGGNTVNAGRSTSGVNSAIVLGTDAGSSTDIVFEANSLGGSFTGSVVNLGSGYAAGTVKFGKNSGYNPTGPQTAPAIPSSGTAYTNPFPFDCAVYITGGTVTAIAIGGTATGLTSGQFFVPAGETIALTYSAAPTWVWVGN